MSAVLQFQTNLQRAECCNCHMVFAMSEAFYKERRNKHDAFYCPAGHPQYFSGKSEEEKLREQLAAKEKSLEWERSRAAYARAEAESLSHKLRTVKGVATKAKKKLARVENGVCPQCNRTFANVARHMQTQHGVECNKPPKGSKTRG